MTLHRTSRRWAIADLAEAAAGAEKADIARPLLAEAEEQAERLGIDSFLVHRAHALLADSVAESEDRFRAALGAAERTGAELESARTHLLYGVWLRRRRRIVDARVHLSAALTAFDRAGAVPFAERALPNCGPPGSPRRLDRVPTLVPMPAPSPRRNCRSLRWPRRG